MAAAHALLFIATFALMFCLFAGLVGALSWVAVDYRQLIRIASGLIVVVMGLHTGGFITISLLDRIFRPNPKMDVNEKPTWRRSVLLGVALGAGWTPCVGPLVVAVIAAANAAGSLVLNIFALLAFSIGFGVPFILVAVGAHWFVQHFSWLRKHPLVIHRIAGIVLIITGLLIIADLFQRITGFFPALI